MQKNFLPIAFLLLLALNMMAQQRAVLTEKKPAVYFDPIQVTTFAGQAKPGFVNGSGPSAMFNSPDGLTTDEAGNIYVADAGNHCIRKITPGGWVSTFAGTGIAGNSDGPALSASFNSPHNLCFDPLGNLYVTDLNNHALRKITTTGMVTTVVNAAGWGAPLPNAYLPYPDMVSIACDGAGNVFLADQHNNLIRKITPQGVVSNFAGTGVQGELDGPRRTATFIEPCDLAFDHQGNLIVAQVYGPPRKIGTDDYVSSLLTPGFYGFKLAVAVDASDNIFVNVIQSGSQCNVSRITPFLQASVIAGNNVGHADSIGSDASFNFPKKITTDRQQNLFVTEETAPSVSNTGHWIRRLTKPTFQFTTTAGTASAARYCRVSANNLQGNAWMEAPAGFEIAPAENGPYTSSLALPPSNGEIVSQQLYIRIRQDARFGARQDSLILRADGAQTQAMVIYANVADSSAPVITTPGDQLFCAARNSLYTIPAIAASDFSGIKTVAYRITGSTMRSGNGVDASGFFAPGISHIQFTVTDSAGNISTCQFMVRVNPAINLVIPDIYPLLLWGDVNTIYLGYGPATVTLSAVVTGGTRTAAHGYLYKWSEGTTGKSITVNPSIPGDYSYSVTITDSLGCMASRSKTIHVVDARCAKHYGKVIVCWPGKHGNTSSCIEEKQVWIALLLGAKLGPCASPGTSERLMETPDERLQANAISVYPNPNKGAFLVRINNLTKVNIEIYDNTGRRLYSKALSADEAPYQQVFTNLGHVANGMYIVRASSREGVFTTKVMVQQ